MGSLLGSLLRAKRRFRILGSWDPPNGPDLGISYMRVRSWDLGSEGQILYLRVRSWDPSDTLYHHILHPIPYIQDIIPYPIPYIIYTLVRYGVP